MKTWRGPYHKKVTPQMKEKMRELREMGLTLQEVANEVGVSNTTVQYHLKARTRRLTKERQRKRHEDGKTWKHKNPEKSREYMRNYMNKRYNNDPEFRDRIKQHVMNHYYRVQESEEEAK